MRTESVLFSTGTSYFQDRKLKEMVRRLILIRYWSDWLKERSEKKKLRLLLAIWAGEEVRVATVSERVRGTRRALSQSHTLSLSFSGTLRSSIRRRSQMASSNVHMV